MKKRVDGPLCPALLQRCLKASPTDHFKAIIYQGGSSERGPFGRFVSEAEITKLLTTDIGARCNVQAVQPCMNESGLRYWHRCERQEV